MAGQNRLMKRSLWWLLLPIASVVVAGLIWQRGSGGRPSPHGLRGGSSAPEERALADCLRRAGVLEGVVFAPLNVAERLPAQVGSGFRIVSESGEHGAAGVHSLWATQLVDESAVRMLREQQVTHIVADSGGLLAYQLARLGPTFRSLGCDGDVVAFEFIDQAPIDPIMAGNTSLAAGDWDAALAIYRSVLDESPDDVLAVLGSAEAALGASDVGDALASYARLLALDGLGGGSPLTPRVAASLRVEPRYLRGYLALGERLPLAVELDLRDRFWTTDRLLDRPELEYGAAVAGGTGSEMVYRTAFVLGGEPRAVLFAHPPSEARFLLRVPAGARFRFSMALDPAVCAAGLGDGVEFAVDVEEEDLRTRVFAETVSPQHWTQDPHWLDREVDLTAWEGRTVSLVLTTGPGPAGDASYDWAGWGEPRIVQPVSYDFLASYPEANVAAGEPGEVRVDTQALRHESRPALLAGSAVSVTYRVTLPVRSTLYFAMGVDPATWSADERDGVRYSVVVTTEDGGSASVYSRYVDPRNARYERRWLGGIVDLGAYGGQTVEITFEALPGARDGAPGTWCGWGTPVLVDDTPADVADGR